MGGMFPAGYFTPGFLPDGYFPGLGGGDTPTPTPSDFDAIYDQIRASNRLNKTLTQLPNDDDGLVFVVDTVADEYLFDWPCLGGAYPGTFSVADKKWFDRAVAAEAAARLWEPILMGAAASGGAAVEIQTGPNRTKYAGPLSDPAKGLQMIAGWRAEAKGFLSRIVCIGLALRNAPTATYGLRVASRSRACAPGGIRW